MNKGTIWTQAPNLGKQSMKLLLAMGTTAISYPVYVHTFTSCLYKPSAWCKYIIDRQKIEFGDFFFPSVEARNCHQSASAG